MESGIPDFAADRLPETPHELPFDRGRVDALLTRVQQGERIDLLDELLEVIAWERFAGANGEPLSPLELVELKDYYRQKWVDVGPLYLADLLSTEFMTEQRARGDLMFSDEMVELGRTNPELWAEIRLLFRRKETASGLLLLAHRARADIAGDDR